MTMRDSYDWSDLEPNVFVGMTHRPVGSVRLPYTSYQGDVRPMAAAMGPVVDLYVEGEVTRSDNGAQADYYSNNADDGCSDEYAIKTFQSFHEAYCAYNRQWLAATEGQAPPVGRMVLFSKVSKSNRINLSSIDMGQGSQRVYRWGYQTAVADMSENEDYRDSSELYEEGEQAWDCHWEEQVADLDLPACFEPGQEMEWDDCYRDEWIQSWVDANRGDYEDTPKAEMESASWDHDYSLLPNERELRVMAQGKTLELDKNGRTWNVEEICTRARRQWNPMWCVEMVEAARAQDVNDLDRVRDTLNDEPNGDLHNMNVGRWEGDAVIIDWGYHIMGGGSNSPGAQITESETPDLEWHYSRQPGVCYDVAQAEKVEIL